MKRINSRRKGIVGELEARDLWREFYPECERSYGQARKQYSQPDLIGGRLEKRFYIEVKRPHNEPTEGKLDKWWEKLTRDWDLGGDFGALPTLMYRKDRGEWKVICKGFTLRHTWPEFAAHLKQIRGQNE